MLCYKCEHSWNYKGKNTEGKGNITCPRCLYKIRVDKAMIEGPLKQELLIKLPTKRPLPNELPNELPRKLPTTRPELRVLQEEETPAPGIGVEEEPTIKTFTNISDFNMEVLAKGYQEEGPTIRTLPLGLEIIRVIPGKSPLEIIEHQRSFF